MTQELEHEHEELLQFLYQCPVALIAMDERGRVERINPAAARLLAPTGSDLLELFPLLLVRAPHLLDGLLGDPGRLGSLGPAGRLVVPSGGGGELQLDVSFARVATGRVMVLLIDVTADLLLLERDRGTAHELQRAMLQRVDVIMGFTVAHAYRAAAAGLEVGGDFYDVLDLPTGEIGLVVGDVPGHGLPAATAMGQLRSALRALAAVSPDPAALLEHTDRFVGGQEGLVCTTVAYTALDRRTGRLRYSCAGHPPPLVVGRGGAARFLDGGRSQPLGCLDPPGYAFAEEQLKRGDSIVLYTDGLVERRGQDLDAGLQRLRTVATALAGQDPARLCDALVGILLADGPPDDDVCVLVARDERAWGSDGRS